MEKFKAIFKTSGKSIPVNIIDNDYFVLNGVRVDVDELECLYIEKWEQYSTKKFQFEYIITSYSFLELIDYELDIFVPINILKKHCKSKDISNLQIHIKRDSNENYSYMYELLKAKSENNDLEIALTEIWEQLSEKYEIKICAYCKNSCWNAYGSGLYNRVCFKEEKEKFWQLNKINKSTIAELMSEEKFQLTSLIGYCEEFVSILDKK